MALIGLKIGNFAAEIQENFFTENGRNLRLFTPSPRPHVTASPPPRVPVSPCPPPTKQFLSLADPNYTLHPTPYTQD
ncbi:MAG: hypothetical protein QNJ68_22290 [Microcoleaceae cyanobacterium MO_207.B10]|nr:hypothetical protein [Microcoleaceae cyanobacterium MO_207.B10]